MCFGWSDNQMELLLWCGLCLQDMSATSGPCQAGRTVGSSRWLALHLAGEAEGYITSSRPCIYQISNLGCTSTGDVGEFFLNIVLSLFISIGFQVELVTPSQKTS